MYLLPASPRTVNKWRMGGLGLAPVRLPNLGASTTAQSWRRPLSGRMSGRRMRGLGDDPPGSGYCTYLNPDGSAPESIDLFSTTAECGANGGVWTAALNTPSPVGRQNTNPVTGGASNGGITTVPAATPSKDPLDYVSPQAAIAAGLPQDAVYAAWTKALARFPSPQAAISAGVPAGVVNQLWQQSNVNAANAAAKSQASSAQLAGILPWAAGGLLLLAVMGGRKR
jgi:hypothetical protein